MKGRNVVRKDDCLNCDDKVWELNGDPWYHPSTGMRKCANGRGGVAAPAGHLVREGEPLADWEIELLEGNSRDNNATRKTLTLNLDNPTDRALYELVSVIRSKRADYAEDGDPWSNFRDIAAEFGGLPWEAANAMERNKLSRIKALRTNGREPTNESVVDSYRDKANFAILAYAMLLDEGSTWEGTK